MSAPLRILLIEDDQDYIQLLHAALEHPPGSFEIRSSSALATGLPAIDDFAPDLILVDLNLSDSSGYETFLRVRERAQGIPIVVLTVCDDNNMAIRAVEDGAQEYFVKSHLQPGLIGRCIQIAATRQNLQGKRKAPPTRAAIVGFIGSKGGVGTSTVAVNIATLLALNGPEALLIELEYGRVGTATLYMENEQRRGLRSLAARPASAITESDIFDCAVPLPYGIRLLCAEDGRSCGALQPEHVRAVISAAHRAFPYVVLDLPPRLNPAVREAIKLAESITMVVDRECSSLESASSLLEEMGTSGIADVQAVLVDRTMTEAPIGLTEVRDCIQVRPLATIPHAASLIALSHSARIPAAALEPRHSFNLAHGELIRQLVPGWSPATRVAGVDRTALQMTDSGVYSVR